MQILDILANAFFLSLVLLGIHSWFGIEIIRRGIIFTDMAIGQMAAVGTAIAIVFFGGHYAYPTALGCSLFAGFLISQMTKKNDNPEPFIGLLYAFGVACVYLILSHSGNGTEVFDRLMASDILFTPLMRIIHTAVIYATIALFLFLSYRRFQGQIRDMIFFLCFAGTVTSSVKLAGVLVVFSLLVSPALISIKIKVKKPLLWAWLIGTVVNLAALIVSYSYDLPTGYTIVAFQTLTGLAVYAVF